MPVARTLVNFKEVAAGALVVAKDRVGVWCNGTVLNKVGRGAGITITVGFVGYKAARFNETFKQNMQKVIERVSPDELLLLNDEEKYRRRRPPR